MKAKNYDVTISNQYDAHANYIFLVIMCLKENTSSILLDKNIENMKKVSFQRSLKLRLKNIEVFQEDGKTQNCQV